VDAPIWDDESVDWTVYDAVVLRSPWDYYLKPDAFRNWINRLEQLDVPLWNPAPTLRWNLDKIYLRDLEQRGVAITPTAFPADGDRLEDIMKTRGWKDVVLKPRVSAAGHRTTRVRQREKDRVAVAQVELDMLNAEGGALVQLFLPVIQTIGEWSFIFLGGHFSHAVLKRPGAGEFRVQEQYGGTAAGGQAPAGLVDQARLVMAAVDLPWIYARVDGCDVDGRLLLMELELLEPSLFLSDGPGAAEEFARVIRDEIRKTSLIG
jgi:glutathione synthase/RimK-type ligase-like ATP-grasp enzyme